MGREPNDLQLIERKNLVQRDDEVVHFVSTVSKDKYFCMALSNLQTKLLIRYRENKKGYL